MTDPPVVPNDEWTATALTLTRWCKPRWFSLPRRHFAFRFVIFDPKLPAYRRCPRCGETIYYLTNDRPLD